MIKVVLTYQFLVCPFDFKKPKHLVLLQMLSEIDSKHFHLLLPHFSVKLDVQNVTIWKVQT